jgi:hypothetical protein
MLKYIYVLLHQVMRIFLQCKISVITIISDLQYKKQGALELHLLILPLTDVEVV